MFPFYCNQCFLRRKYETTLQLFVSRCGHILCNGCLQDNCAICRRPFKPVAINNEMPPAMAEYFSSPMKQYQQFKKVMKFQQEQERRLVEHLTRSNEEQSKKVQHELQGLAKLENSLRREVEHEKERIRKLREYTVYFDRRMEQSRYMVPPITTVPRPRYPTQLQNANNVATVTNSAKRFTQIIRPNIIHPKSPTLSANTSSLNAEEQPAVKPVQKKQRSPPPLLPFSQHKLLNPHFSFDTSI